MKNTARRTGSSLMHTVQTCPAATAVTLGFTEEQAARILGTRRVLPYAEDRTAPNLDARKLWERIGKPWGRFNMWVSSEARTFAVFAAKGQVLEIVTPTKGRPRLDYLLSRDCAASLAMQADNAAGDSIRAAFLDMEELALRLAVHAPLRAHRLGAAGDELAHLCIKAAGDLVRDGLLSKAALHTVAKETHRDALRMVSEVLTGKPTAAWRATFGKGIRDVLDTKDLDQYARAFEVLLALLRAGHTLPAIRKVLEASFLGKVAPAKYADEWTEADQEDAPKPPALDAEGITDF